MPTPTQQLARTRPDITESMREFDLDANINKMIGTEVFPVFDAPAQAGVFGRIPIEQLLEKGDTSRASGADYNRGDYEFVEEWFATRENGWEEPCDERDRNIYADWFTAELVAAERARSKVMVNMETRVANLVNNLPNQTAVGTAWSNWTGASPINDVEGAVTAVYNRTGLWPNALILSYLDFRNVRNCDQVLDRIAAQGSGDKIRATDVTIAQLAEVFDLPNIQVGGSSQNTANKGQAVAVAQIWGGTATVAVLNTSNDIRQPGLGRTFHWAADGSAIGTRQESYWWEPNRSEIHRSRHETHEKLIYPEVGQNLTGI